MCEMAREAEPPIPGGAKAFWSERVRWREAGEAGLRLAGVKRVWKSPSG